MLFNSLIFICFFPIVCIAYYLCPYRFIWIVLLVSSYIFYMCWNAKYVFLLFSVTIVTWVIGNGIDHTINQIFRKLLLVFGVFFNLALLFVFKCLTFFDEIVYDLLGHHPAPFSIVLPVGISFFTFQAMGYMIDVYRGDIKSQTHFGKYALFISFFPQLVAGPIERSKNLLPQFEEKHYFNPDQAASGLRLMLWGYFKKIVIADTICTSVDRVFGNLSVFKGFPLILAAFLFSIQIFCDFSGYSDIARGCARIMGFRLMRNFDHPYYATSIKDFWRKWHISLSTWFRDYVYIPLGGNNKKIRNLLITFLISGLWHGADWTFIIWGGIHAVYQIVGEWIAPIREKVVVSLRLSRFERVRYYFKILITFTLVSLAWIPFRASNLKDTVYFITHMFSFDGLSFGSIYAALKLVFGTRAELYRLVLTLPVFLLASFIDWKWSLNRIIMRRNYFVRILFFSVAIAYILLAARGNVQDFIYFQF